jgi:hypothetical protein
MKIQVVLTWAMLLALLPGETATAQPANVSGPAGKITPSELLAKENQLTNQPVTVEGVLVNQGTNYFTDLKVVLKDGKDRSETGVRVQPWLPTELPPLPSGNRSSRPTLSDYLGKRIVVEGVLTDSAAENGGTAKILRVDKARIVE